MGWGVGAAGVGVGLLPEAPGSGATRGGPDRRGPEAELIAEPRVKDKTPSPPPGAALFPRAPATRA